MVKKFSSCMEKLKTDLNYKNGAQKLSQNMNNLRLAINNMHAKLTSIADHIVGKNQNFFNDFGAEFLNLKECVNEALKGKINDKVMKKQINQLSQLLTDSSIKKLIKINADGSIVGPHLVEITIGSKEEERVWFTDGTTNDESESSIAQQNQESCSSSSSGKAVALKENKTDGQRRVRQGGLSPTPGPSAASGDKALPDVPESSTKTRKLFRKKQDPKQAQAPGPKSAPPLMPPKSPLSNVGIIRAAKTAAVDDYDDPWDSKGISKQSRNLVEGARNAMLMPKKTTDEYAVVNLAFIQAKRDRKKEGAHDAAAVPTRPMRPSSRPPVVPTNKPGHIVKDVLRVQKKDREIVAREEALKKMQADD